MTVIGVSTMQGSLLEVKMAGTAQQQVIATRQVERTLLAAEARLEAIVADATPFEFASSGDGYYLPGDKAAVSNSDWSGLSAQAGPIDGSTVIGEYVIEYFGARTVPGEKVTIDTDGKITGGVVYTFRNSARSSPRPGAVRIVQSLYTTTEAP